VPVSSGGGYGYFQRASDPTQQQQQQQQGGAAGYNQKSNYNTSQQQQQQPPQQQQQGQGYGYGGSVKPYGGSNQYQNKSYSNHSSSYGGGNSNSGGYQRQSNPQGYNSGGYSKPKSTNQGQQKAGNHQNAYEKVVYNAASNFLSQQAQGSGGKRSEKPTFKLGNQKPSWGKTNAPAKPQQLHYCEVCKISCAGPQTYKEHLEGQKHKKKAASATTDSKKLPPGTYKCELCDVVCTGKDAFNAHIKGANHGRTIKLHQKLGKPIPEIKAVEGTSETKKPNIVKTTPLKMNFVGGTKLTSTGSEEKIEASKEDSAEYEQEVPVEGTPVGESYIEDIKSDSGKVIGFKCTICDCRFNDHVAKVAHLKGRRHRLSYKKKVDPTIQVDMKGSRTNNRRNRQSIEGAGAVGDEQESVWRQRQHEQMQWERQLRLREEELRRWEHDDYMKRANEDRYWTRPDRHRMQELEHYEWERRENYSEQPMMFPRQGPPPPSPDDRLVMQKHADIYPADGELKQVQTTVAAVEKALKLVSDTIGDKETADEPEVKQEPQEEKDDETSETKDEKSPKKPLKKKNLNSNNRILKGVMRVGPLCTGLLLKGQLAVDLVVLCADKPTKTLLTRVGKLVPEKLNESAPDAKYNMAIRMADCCLVVTSTTDPKCVVTVTLTSPACREEDELENKEQKETVVIKKEPVDEKDVLDKEKTLQALAALRHAKWFQARANQLQSCVITIRIMRDICQRVAAFKPLTGWAIELLCEKAIGSNFGPVAPGEAFRRVLEAVSSGIFLPGGTGLLDPCEKDKTDASAYLGQQEREDITAASQQALRLFAFRQIHKVLGIEPLKPNPNRKRRAENTEENAAAEPAKVAKKED